MIWTGGDATLEYAGAVDWQNKKFYSSPVERFYGIVKATMDQAPEDVIISTAELLTYVVLAAMQEEEWKERTVIYVGDNQNVVTWLNDRYSKSPVVQTILRWLELQEARADFEPVGPSVRTRKNGAGGGLATDERARESMRTR